MKEVFQVIESMKRAGVIDDYAVAGAVGALFYVKAFSTADIDFLVRLPLSDGMLVSLGMNRNRKSRNIARSVNDGQAEPNAVFKAVLIYENVTAGARAQCCLERLARESGKTLEEQMWNFDVLGIREERNGAASAARKADVVAFSASGQLEFPGAVRRGSICGSGYSKTRILRSWRSWIHRLRQPLGRFTPI